MTKTEARAVFGSFVNMAESLKMTPQGITKWPEQLDQDKIDQIVGAAIRLGKTLPIDYQWAIRNYCGTIHDRKIAV